MSEFSENLPPNNKQIFLGDLNNHYHQTIDYLIFYYHLGDVWTRTDEEESVLLRYDKEMKRIRMLGSYQVRAFELLVAFQELKPSTITRETLNQAEQEQWFAGKTVVSVGGFLGECFSIYGAHCISIDPMFDYIDVPKIVDKSIVRVADVVSGKTAHQLIPNSKPDIILCSGLYELESGVEERTGYQDLQDGLQQLMRRNNAHLVIKGTDVLNDYFLRTNGYEDKLKTVGQLPGDTLRVIKLQ